MRSDVTLNRHQAFANRNSRNPSHPFPVRAFNVENTGWEIFGETEIEGWRGCRRKIPSAHMKRDLLIQHPRHLPTEETPNRKNAKYKGTN
jgi:hypothetical protein